MLAAGGMLFLPFAHKAAAAEVLRAGWSQDSTVGLLATTSSSGHSEAVVACPFSSSQLAEFGTQGAPVPGPAPATTLVPITLPPGSAVYGTGFPGGAQYALGPAHYACVPGYSYADGGAVQGVVPSPGSTLGVSSIFNPGGIGPATDLACPYIPAVRTVDITFRGGLAGCAHPGTDDVDQIPTAISNSYIAVVEVPAATTDPNLNGSGHGMVTFALYTAQVFPAGPSAGGQSVSCILPPHDTPICAASLEFFLATQSFVGRALGQSELDTAEDEIATFVASTGLSSSTSPIATTLPTPHQAFSSVIHTVENVAIASAAIVFITFPAQMFNSTLDENYVEILAMWRRFLWRLGGKRRLARKRRRAQQEKTAPKETSRRGELITFATVVVIGSLIGGFRDPRFGFNLASVANFFGTLGALIVLIAVPAAAAIAYRRKRGRPAHIKLRAIPAGIAIAVVSVLISRLAHFQPGYLYGIVCGIAFAHRLGKSEEGHVVGLESTATLLAAVAAWVAFIPIDRLALHPEPNFGIVLVDDWLASIFVGGLVGVTIGLLPLRFLPGGTLAQWHRGLWAAMFGIALFGVVAIMLRPSSGPARPGSAPVVTAVVLFVVFGGVSVAFREYFARRKPAGDRESRVTAPTGVERFR
jgi:hypothetical protein